MSIEPDTANEAEAFLIESGVLRSILLNSALVCLRRHLNRDGNVAVVHRHDGGTLWVKAMLHRRWRWADAETIERLILGTIRDGNAYVRIQGVRLHRRNEYVEAEVRLN